MLLLLSLLLLLVLCLSLLFVLRARTFEEKHGGDVPRGIWQRPLSVEAVIPPGIIVEDVLDGGVVANVAGKPPIDAVPEGRPSRKGGRAVRLDHIGRCSRQAETVTPRILGMMRWRGESRCRGKVRGLPLDLNPLTRRRVLNHGGVRDGCRGRGCERDVFGICWWKLSYGVGGLKVEVAKVEHVDVVHDPIPLILIVEGFFVWMSAHCRSDWV